MPRKRREIHIELKWSETEDPNAIQRWVRATEVLLRIQERLDAKKQEENPDPPNDSGSD